MKYYAEFLEKRSYAFDENTILYTYNPLNLRICEQS